MYGAKRIVKTIVAATTILSLVACSDAGFSSSARSKESLLTLKTVLSLDTDQRAAVLDERSADCVVPQLGFPDGDGDLGQYWRDSDQCFTVCVVEPPENPTIPNDDTRPIILTQTILGVDQLERYVTEQDDDSYDDVIGSCGAVSIHYGSTGSVTIQK